MTDAVQLGLITAIPAIIAALGTFYNNREIIRSRYAQELQHEQNTLILKDTRQVAVQTSQAMNKQSSDMEALRDQTNGIQEKLLKVTGESEYARGKAEGEKC